MPGGDLAEIRAPNSKAGNPPRLGSGGPGFGPTVVAAEAKLAEELDPVQLGGVGAVNVGGLRTEQRDLRRVRGVLGVGAPLEHLLVHPSVVEGVEADRGQAVELEVRPGETRVTFELSARPFFIFDPHPCGPQVNCRCR